MSALPRPDLPPGPHRELADALHELHHRAGWPSLRRMAAVVGTSHTTVSKAFSSPSLPSWGTLELLVEVLGGDAGSFHELWLRASSSTNPSPPGASARIAGRRRELAAVLQHLDSGAGLMVVAGEAGMGKTRLVTTALQRSDVLVAVGHALPLSMQAPLMPIAEALRAVHDGDGGRRLEETLAEEPAYVRASLGRLLPEIAEAGASPVPSDEFSRQQLWAAVSRCLAGIHMHGGLGLLMEDLHWADTATLDLIEHLVASGSPVPIVATWRRDDPDTGDPQRGWWLRMTRLPGVTTLDLAPLTRQASGEQCRLLGLDLDEAEIDGIHRRSGGQPLFTEQLAVHAGAGDLPVVLADLLDDRLGQLSEVAHAITKALGVADRGLPPHVLCAVTGLDDEQLVRGLHELARNHLLARAETPDDVRLRHPLMAEAARRRLVAGEVAAVHRALATVLGAQPDASAPEVAAHWWGAGDEEQELQWRIAAARDAEARWAASQAAEHWLRALQAWPDSASAAGDPPLARPEAYLAAIDALKDSLQFDRAAAMSADADAQFPELEPALRAEFLRRAAVYRTDLEGPEVGLELVEEAIAILSDLPVGVGLARAMARKHQVLVRMGRYDEAIRVAREGIMAAEASEDRYVQRLLLGHVAWHQAVVDGALARGSATMAHARSLSSSAEDPSGEIFLAVIWTDVLLNLGAGSAEVVAAGADAMALAEEHGIADFGPVLVRYNMVRALVEDGRLVEADALLGSEVRGEPDLDRAPLFILRALLDALAGRLDAAAGTIDALVDGMTLPQRDLEYAGAIAIVDLWCDRPGDAWSRVLVAVEAKLDSPTVLLMPALVLGARAGADLVAQGAADADLLRAQLTDLHRRAGVRPSATSRTARALAATWSAELARLDSGDSTRLWQTAEAEWSTLGRPHDAAYCGWRAAQAALRLGHGTLAGRLLRRAVTNARGHEPLRVALAATGSARMGATSAAD